MAGPWTLMFCVLVVILSVGCSNFPLKQTVGVTTRTPVTLGDVLELSGPKERLSRDRVKRKVQHCPLMETKDGSGMQKIIDKGPLTTYNFFIQPQRGFHKLVFRAKMNKKYTSGSWKYSKKSITVNSPQMNIDWTHPTWIPVQIEYFKKNVRFWPDSHALRVKVGTHVNQELIAKWWRTHSYEGFMVEAEGPLKFVLNCDLTIAVAELKTDTEDGIRHTVLIACILGGCFLLVVGTITLYLLITNRSRPSLDYQYNTPPVTPLAQERCATKDENGENIYESIDDNLLNRLRNKFDADKLSAGLTKHRKDHCSGSSAERNDNKNIALDPCVRRPCHSPECSVDGARDVMTMSLLEQKEALRDDFNLDSPVESHYVEMHGIVRQNSIINK